MSGWQWVIVVGISGFVVLMLSQVAVGMRAGAASIADKQLQLGREHEIAPREEPNPIGRERFAAADDPPFEGTTDEVDPA